MPSIDSSEELQESVCKIRELFVEDYEQNKELYFDGDVERIKEDDWYVQRFLLRNKRQIEPSLEMLKNCMRWRHELQIPVLKETDFPQEFYKIGGVFSYCKDRDGNGMIYMRIKLHRKIPELDLALKQFVIYTMNKVDVEVNGNGMAIVFDCKDAGVSNVDMDMLWFLISSMNKYYPKGLSYILVYELPWILNAVWKIAKSWIPEEQRKLIKFANKDDIENYVDKQNLPDFLGGVCDREYRVVPKGCPTAEEVAKNRGLTDKEIEKIRKIFESHLI
ncbi:motile sperm domain-containing protein 2-like [Oppia nitens]|uniref:motile sperm domain-containing protein 2-like n=1 Tax=Oppia nitens TaxID=1686743 RepID=UPI0023DA9C72|nr:motile sperm domain-containing protein 2-like [Oppia nitens]